MRVGQYCVKHWGRTAIYDHKQIEQKLKAGCQPKDIAASMECSVRVVVNVKQKMERRRRVL
jgi:hypothetical protein